MKINFNKINIVKILNIDRNVVKILEIKAKY